MPLFPLAYTPKNMTHFQCQFVNTCVKFYENKTHDFQIIIKNGNRNYHFKFSEQNDVIKGE